MAFALLITCNGCLFRQLAGLDSHCICYWLSEDVFAPMPYTAAWCKCCEKVVVAEEVPDTAKLEERGERWLRLLRRRGSGPGDNFYERKKREFANQVAWRSARGGPPRCLICRSASVSFLDLSGEPPLELPHPGCRGRLIVELGAHYHTRMMLIYSIEGEFLGFGSRADVFQPPGRPLPPSESYLWWWVDIDGRKPAERGFASDRGAS